MRSGRDVLRCSRPISLPLNAFERGMCPRKQRAIWGLDNVVFWKTQGVKTFEEASFRSQIRLLAGAARAGSSGRCGNAGRQ